MDNVYICLNCGYVFKFPVYKERYVGTIRKHKPPYDKREGDLKRDCIAVCPKCGSDVMQAMSKDVLFKKSIKKKQKELEEEEENRGIMELSELFEEEGK